MGGLKKRLKKTYIIQKYGWSIISYDRFTDIFTVAMLPFLQEEVGGPRTSIEVTIKQGSLGGDLVIQWWCHQTAKAETFNINQWDFMGFHGIQRDLTGFNEI